jgi:small subunit ribosomal protein S18
MFREKKKYFQVKKVCEFCKNKTKTIDYKNIKVLQKYMSFYGKIESRKKTGCCAKHQRMMSTEIKRARMVALLPFTSR